MITELVVRDLAVNICRSLHTQRQTHRQDRDRDITHGLETKEGSGANEHR
jgi:hypothetical protein